MKWGMRIFFYSLALIFLGWLLYKDLAVNGVLEAVYDFENQSPFITVLRPQGRVSDIFYDAGDAFQEIQKEPIYFDARLPRIFEVAEVTLRYKNYGEPIIELGAMKDPERRSFDLKPLENTVLNKILKDKFRWSNLREDDIFLFQKNSRFKNIKDFLENLPDTSQIGTYHYEIPRKFKIPSYAERDGGVTVKKTLRGTHRFITYVKNEDLNIEFLFQDLNRHPGDDYASLNVYHEDENVYEDFIRMDKNSSDKGGLSEVKEVKLNIPKLEEGVYVIEVFAPSDDIVMRWVSTTQDFFIVKNRVYLGDNAGYVDEWSEDRVAPTVLYTSAKALTAKTTHAEGIQDLEINNSIFPIQETHKKYFYKMSQVMNKILSPKNDIILESNGVFSFTKESFFNPEPFRIISESEFDSSNIQYVISEYSEPKASSAGWKENTVRFRIADYDTRDRELHFILSIPSLEENRKGLAVSEIRIRFIDEPLSWSDFVNYLKRYVRQE